MHFDIRQTLVGTFIWDVPGQVRLASYVGADGTRAIVTATTGSPSANGWRGQRSARDWFNGDFSMTTRISLRVATRFMGVNYLNTSCFTCQARRQRLPRQTVCRIMRDED